VRVVPFLLLCVLSTGGRPLLGQDAASSDYRELASLYRTAPDEAVSRVLQLTADQREAAVVAAVTAESDWPWADLASAAMLETDAALTHLRRSDAAGAPHLEIAERLLSRGLQAAPEQVAFVTRWYRGVAAVLRLNGAFTAAQAIDRRRWDLAMRQPQFGHALDVLTSGIAAEYAGCVQEDVVASDPRQFASAVHDFTEALTIDPALLDAALHLGRIRMLQGDATEARQLFQRAVASPSRATAYLAHLFLGAIAERESAWNEAERHYRDAQSILPAGQAAALSIAALLDRRGLAPESASAIQSMFERTALRQIADPWWAYFNGLGRDPDVILRALRTEVSR
jgi:tetratricopeptide (TPR) repeat protein